MLVATFKLFKLFVPNYSNLPKPISSLFYILYAATFVYIIGLKHNCLPGVILVVPTVKIIKTN